MYSNRWMRCRIVACATLDAGMRHLGIGLACALALFAMTGTYRHALADPPGGTSGWTPTFSDTFNGDAVNTNTWIPWATYTSNGELLPTPNWSPSPYAADCYYVPSNISVYDNLLTEVARAGDNEPPGATQGTLPYSSAFLTTNNFQQTYGYFECNMDAQITEGDDTAFWMTSRNIWPPEIDVAEFPSAPQGVYWNDAGPLTAQGYGLDENVIASDDSAGNWYAFPSGENSGWAYHTYGVDWEPTYMSFYIDGNLIYTTTDTNAIPTIPLGMQVAMQVQSDNSGGDWYGQASGGTWPDYTYVSWVKAWIKNDSSLSAPTGVTANGSNAYTTLNWSAVSGATCYNVYRGTTSGGEDPSAIATDVTTTSYQDTNVTGGTQYYYEVAAVDAGGTSAMSSEVSATPQNATAWVTGTTTGTLRNDFTGFVGLEFTTGSSPVTITALGRWVVSGNSDTHMVKLSQASDGSDVPGGEVMVNTEGQPAGQYCYMPLPAPLTLPANTTYYLVSTETSGGDYWYDANTTLTTTGAAADNGSEYVSPTTWWTSGGTGAGTSYVPLSFLYGSSTPPIAYIQGAANGGSSGASSQTVTFPGAQTAGDLNVVIIGGEPSFGISSVTDSAGNTYQLASGPTSTGDAEDAIYYASNINSSSSNTVTVTYGGSTAWPDIEAMEFSGVSTLDQTASGTGWSSSPSTSSATTTAANELIVGSCCDDQSLSSPGSGFTFGPNDSFGYGGEYEIVNSTGSYSADMSLTGSGYWAMDMATFK